MGKFHMDYSICMLIFLSKQIVRYGPKLEQLCVYKENMTDELYGGNCYSITRAGDWFKYEYIQVLDFIHVSM